MANWSVPPFFGACAPASDIVPPRATAAAPLIRTERLVTCGFMGLPPQSFFSRRPRDTAIRPYGRPRGGLALTHERLESPAGTLRRQSDSAYGRRSRSAG